MERMEQSPRSSQVPASTSEALQVLVDLETEPPGTIPPSQVLSAIDFLKSDQSPITEDRQNLTGLDLLYQPLIFDAYVGGDLISQDLLAASMPQEKRTCAILLALNAVTSQALPDTEAQEGALHRLARLLNAARIRMPGCDLVWRDDGSFAQEWCPYSPLSTHLILYSFRLFRRAMALFHDAPPGSSLGQAALDVASSALGFFAFDIDGPTHMKRTTDADVRRLAQEMGSFVVEFGDFLALLEDSEIPVVLQDDAPFVALEGVIRCHASGNPNTTLSIHASRRCPGDPKRVIFYDTINGVYRSYALSSDGTSDAQGRACGSPFPHLIRGIALWAQINYDPPNPDELPCWAGFLKLILAHITDCTPQLTEFAKPGGNRRARRHPSTPSQASTIRTLEALLDSICEHVNPSALFYGPAGEVECIAERYEVWDAALGLIDVVVSTSGWLAPSDFARAHANFLSDTIETIVTLPWVSDFFAATRGVSSFENMFQDRLHDLLRSHYMVLMPFLFCPVARLRLRTATEHSGVIQRLAECNQLLRRGGPAPEVPGLADILRFRPGMVIAIYRPLCKDESRSFGCRTARSAAKFSNLVQGIARLPLATAPGVYGMQHGVSPASAMCLEMAKLACMMCVAPFCPRRFLNAPFDLIPIATRLEDLLQMWAAGTAPTWMVFVAAEILMGLHTMVRRALSILNDPSAASSAARGAAEPAGAMDPGRLPPQGARGQEGSEAVAALRKTLEAAQKRLALVQRRTLREFIPAAEARREGMLVVGASPA